MDVSPRRSPFVPRSIHAAHRFVIALAWGGMTIRLTMPPADPRGFTDVGRIAGPPYDTAHVGRNDNPPYHAVV
jgi:hypothetical protein